MNKEEIQKKAVVVKAKKEKHLEFFKDQISTLLPNTTWYENNFLNLFNEDHKTFVVEIDNIPVSFCSFIIADQVADIDATATKKEFQNLGLGSFCFYKALTQLKNDKIHTVFLEVAKNNKKAIKFYEKMGFEYQNRSIKNYYNDGQDALIYSLSL